MKTEKKDSAKIIVTTHKKYRMPKDPLYLPLQVGAGVEKKGVKTPSLGYACDDTGANISKKNPLFCELTGLYWAWKNLDAEYIGLVHYRRYFGRDRYAYRKHLPQWVRLHSPWTKILKSEDVERLMEKYRILVPAKRRYYIETLYSHYEHTHFVHHLHVTRGIISKLCPEYLTVYDRVLKQTSGYMFNMMVMDRALLDDYCSWLFPILFALEQKIDVTELSYYQGRYCGRVGEIIFNVWLAYQLESGRLARNEVLELPYIYMEKIDWIKKVKSFLLAKFLHKRYEQ